MKINLLYLGAVGLGVIPLSIAQRQGLFRKYGVDVQLVPVPGTRVPELTKENPFGYIGAPAAVMRRAGGTDLRVLASFDNGRLSNLLIASPTIKKPDELRGKRLGVRVTGAALWIHTIVALEQLGLNPKRDNISLLEIGDPDQIARALEAGSIDAAVLSRAQSRQLTARGYPVLLDLYPANLYGAQDALVVTTAFLQQHPDAAENIVAAMIEAAAFSLSARERPAILETIMKELVVTDRAAAEDGLAQLSLIISRKPYPSVERLRNMQRIMSLHDPKALSVKVEDLIDDRFVRKFDESGFIERTYGTYEVT